MTEGTTPGDADPTGQVAGWWSTAISDISPGHIALRGHEIGDLLREHSYVDVLWMMIMGDFPSPGRRRLLEAALVASVDHGPQAPSIASARMAATCGVGLNSAVANGVNVLGDVHGGAGQQCVRLLEEIVSAQRGLQLVDAGTDLDPDPCLPAATATVVARWRRTSPYLPGFGHRFHPVDPRRDPLLELLATARTAGDIEGRYVDAGLAIEQLLREERAGRSPVPINVDGVTAMIYAELGVPPELARGFFVLGRSVGILAHAWEQTQEGGRIKGPVPPSILPRYTGS